ncbi:hypothetical protein SAMN05216389_106147 [Oceanobacillus limi]|uniref:Uncharacterized protein n=1 Tax=Oceanobacillus limi TaxID=930131 RepID=A0A1I0CDD9_9BACI|nr:hypothetical protein SAMN05216389_106147 [Oceanobacillus limi]
MWQFLVELWPGKLYIFCTFLAFAIPYLTYKTNQLLHKHGDPPWKKTNE